MRLRTILILTWLAPSLAAQVPDSALRVPGATVVGVVHDSVAHAPLGRATVQLVASERSPRFGRTELADSLGRFVVGSLPAGRYMIGFFHPMLDSLGLEPPLREVDVSDAGAVRADLAIPSPARLRRAICGDARIGAVVVGTVRDAATGAPIGGATVTGSWMELSLTPKGVRRRLPRVESGTAPTGWFALCRVPGAGTVVLQASRDADSTDRIEVQVPADGFVRRELFLGSARASDESPGARRRGDGRLSGTVVASADGAPIAGAIVGLVAGPVSRTNDRGEWTLLDAPSGTRMLEVRALGFYPVRRRVDVVHDAHLVRVALSTVEAVLDTVRVTAGLSRDRDSTGFAGRLRAGVGTFLTAVDIARRQPLATSDVFRTVTSLRVEPARQGGNSRIVMRGTDGWCSPSIYLDGYYVGGLVIPGAPVYEFTTDDLDIWIKPERIAGMEVYVQGTVPVQYQQPLGTCGSILIWSK